MSGNPSIIHFFHIPRTGGNSIYRFWTGAQMRKRHGIRLDNNGHTPYRPFNFPTFTFLRDPVQHAVSLYTYIKTHPGMKAHKQVRNIPFSKWIRLPQRPGSFSHFFGIGRIKKNGRGWRDFREEELEAALRSIDEVSFVGFTERLEEDMNFMLKNVEKVKAKWTKVRFNASDKKKKPRPTPADVQHIKNVRAEDYALLRFIKKKRGLLNQPRS